MMSMMELQLGLALSSNSRTGFDLNCSNCDQKNKNCRKKIKKRRFDEAFESGAENDVEVIQTLPLLVWDKNPYERNEENEDSNSIVTKREDEDEEEGVVGWPPINSLRRKLCLQRRPSCEVNYVTVENGGGGGQRRGSSNSLFVKVKMEGVGIARKIDLTAHHSYQTLTNTLIGLFGRSQEAVEAYKLTYQDKEGDWLLAGDVPWGTFIQSVQRLKLVKAAE